jgi:hypothetical protein
MYVQGADLESFWTFEKKVTPKYPRGSLRKGEQGCAAIGFVVEPDGTTSNHKAIAVFPSDSFTESSIRAAERFIFEPAEGNPERASVFTVHSFTFQIPEDGKPDTEQRDKLEDLCTDAANKAIMPGSRDAGGG